MVIPKDIFFYSILTRIMDSFSCSPLYLFINSYQNKLPEVPEYAKMQFHMITLLDALGKIRFYIPGEKSQTSFTGVQEKKVFTDLCSNELC